MTSLLAPIRKPGFAVGHGLRRIRPAKPLVQLMPFVLVLAIFYFVILLPMKRRQKKVQAFLTALKVGDKVVTSGGIYGSMTKLSDQSVQLQIAQNVRIEVSRAAIVGYQGQEPVVDAPSTGKVMAKNLRWKVITIVVIVVGAGDLGVRTRPQQKVNLGLDLKGGVHLVLRVQTDDALRLETETTTERLREQLQTAKHSGAAPSRRSSPTEFRVDGVPADQDAGVPAGARRTSRSMFNRVLGGRRRLHLHDEAEHRRPAARGSGDAGAADDRAARQRARRRRADRGAHSGADQILVQLPGVTDVRAPRRSSARRRSSS